MEKQSEISPAKNSTLFIKQKTNLLVYFILMQQIITVNSKEKKKKKKKKRSFINSTNSR